MLTILASQNLKTQASKTLKTLFDACKTKSNQPIAFVSKELTAFDFENITGTSIKDFIEEHNGQTTKNDKLNACMYLPLQSKLFVDLCDKQCHNNDISSIRKLIIPLKYKHDVQNIYIDNLDKITVNQLHNFEDRAFETEYKLALLFYMSKKFHLHFFIGMPLLKEEAKPKNIKHLNAGNCFDLIDYVIFNQ